MEIKIERYEKGSETLSVLEKKWKKLEKGSTNVTIFTSWHWIGCWLNILNFPAWVIEIEINQEIIALGIFVQKNTGIWPFNKKQLWLNKTGQQELDQIWIEYNDFVIHEEYEQQFYSTILPQLVDKLTSSFDEVHIDCTCNETFDAIKGSRLKMDTVGYVKTLQKNIDDLDLTLGFSKNTRQQIKRSEKLLKESGKLVLEIANNAQSREAFLKETAELHIKRWGNTPWGSGFQNPHFVDFHYDLIAQADTYLLKLVHNERCIACGYYLIYRNRVYFYLSGIEFNDDNRIKVGLVFHYMAMELFKGKGFLTYDFLGGDARYKKSLSDTPYPLYSWVISKVNWIYRIEQTIRLIKNHLHSAKNKIRKTLSNLS